ncbi:hypothetical protein vBVpaMR16F_253 [Vibrio phage vB_VpaM_R16F]|nr:hypothetical protein vBVpaMR16F_253 [Vibrio phage vB_VpaM_R16F]
MEHLAHIFVLLLIFQFKHWLCDYPLQTPYMLQKFKLKGWVLPLACHAGVHSLLTLFVLTSVYFIWETTLTYDTVLLLSIFDFTIHFITDRIKAHPNLGGKYKMDNPKFWWSLGADQMVHHITHYMIILMIVTHLI